MRKKRVEFLHKVFDGSGGTETGVEIAPIAGELALDRESTIAVIKYLKGEGLLDWDVMGKVHLTHKGIVHVEESKEEHTDQAGGGFVSHISIGTINVTGGVANLGQVIGSIEQHLTQISNSGNTNIATVIKDFTQAVVDDGNLNQSAKVEVLEHLNTIAEEADKEPGKRKKSLVKVVLPAVSDLIGTSASLMALWDRFSPQLYALFELVK